MVSIMFDIDLANDLRNFTIIDASGSVSMALKQGCNHHKQLEIAKFFIFFLLLCCCLG